MDLNQLIQQLMMQGYYTGAGAPGNQDPYAWKYATGADAPGNAKPTGQTQASGEDQDFKRFAGKMGRGSAPKAQPQIGVLGQMQPAPEAQLTGLSPYERAMAAIMQQLSAR